MIHVTKSPPTKSSRGHVKHTGIVQSLRDRIVRGQLGPGDKLPTRIELERSFGATVVTVQRALDVLTREGYVYSSGRRGTFVADHPPNRDRFALVFNNHPGQGGKQWSRFYAALQDSAIKVSRSGPRTVVPIFDINEMMELETYRNLVEDAKVRRLAGLIFAFPPFGMEDSELLRMSGLARVAFMTKPMPNLPCIANDMPEFFKQAARHLSSKGCRRVAVLSAGTPKFYTDGRMESGFRAMKLELRPYWVQCPVFSDPVAVRNCVHLLLHGPTHDRPDALIIADDHLIGPTTQALLEHPKVRVPRDLKVVGMCNFPWPPSHFVPMTRLGFDVHQSLLKAMSLIDLINAGKKVPNVTMVTPMMEADAES